MRILFIDDDEILHRTIGDFLEKHGYEVIYAYSGKNGLDLFSENKIDLVITDIFLPDYLRASRNLSSRLPIMNESFGFCFCSAIAQITIDIFGRSARKMGSCLPTLISLS